MNINRKSFLRTLGGALFSTGLYLKSPMYDPAKSESGLKLGLASYTLRKFTLDQVITFCHLLGIGELALKSMHLPLDSSPQDIIKVAGEVRSAGINLYGAGVVYMKSPEEVTNAFTYAQKAGMKVIIGVPNHDLLPLVESKVKATNIKLAIHNHGPGDELYRTPAVAYELVKDMDPRMGLCIDIGHVVRIDEDPIEDIRNFADRLFDLHLKDVNKAEADGHSVEIGRGIIDIPAVLEALVKVKYAGIMGLEYEKDGDDPIAGLAESIGYVRGVMRMMQ
ncbi:MAG: sugar phosphate isomerase/epimerase [Saprospiraceae bacterium]|nr:sugar phosphate isomerase/epimerase [Saprospiraceae bacterium]